MVTLALDFEQNGVHFIDEDHGFEDFCEQLRVICKLFVNELSFEVDNSIGGYFSELALMVETLSEDEFSVGMPDSGCQLPSQGPPYKVVDHLSY